MKRVIVLMIMVYCTITSCMKKGDTEPKPVDKKTEFLVAASNRFPAWGTVKFQGAAPALNGQGDYIHGSGNFGTISYRGKTFDFTVDSLETSYYAPQEHQAKSWYYPVTLTRDAKLSGQARIGRENTAVGDGFYYIRIISDEGDVFASSIYKMEQ